MFDSMKISSYEFQYFPSCLVISFSNKFSKCASDSKNPNTLLLNTSSKYTNYVESVKNPPVLK